MNFEKIINGELKPYQKDFCNYLLTHKYVFNGSKPGTGKTVMALAPCFIMSEFRVLIIAPAYLTRNWYEEVIKWQTTEHFPKIFRSPRDFKNQKKFKLCISTYGRLRHINHPFDIIIVDEAHQLKNREAKRTKEFLKYLVSHRPKYLMLLSGTPILNNNTEWFTQLKFLGLCPTNTNGIKLTGDFDTFAEKVCFVHKYKTKVYSHNRQRDIEIEVKKYSGSKNPQYLKSLLQDKFFMVTEKEADIPPIVERDIFFESKTSMEDIELHRGFKKTGEAIPPSITTLKANNAKRKASLTAKFVYELVGTEGGPVVIFSDHVTSCQIIAEDLRKLKVGRVEIIDGSVTPEIRHKLVDSFQKGLIQILICTIGSASTGFNMTIASKIVFNDLSWSFEINKQAMKRIHRIGQLHTVFIYFIHSGEIDLKINRNIRQKSQDVGGTEDVLQRS